MDEELKGIISKMIDNGETQSAIDFVISEYQSKKKRGEPSTPKPLANTPSPFPAPSELERGNAFSNPFRNTDDNGEHTVFEPNVDWQGGYNPVPIQAKTIPITPYQDSKSYVGALQKRVLLGQTTPQDKAVLAQNKRAEYVDAEDEDYVGGIATELNPAAAGIKFGEQFKTVDEKLAAVDRLSKQVVDNFQKYNKRGEGDRERAADLDEVTAGKVQQLQAIKGKLIKEKSLTDAYPVYEQATVSSDAGSNWLDRLKEVAPKLTVMGWVADKVAKNILGVDSAPIVEKKLKQMPAAFSVGMNQLRYSDPEVFKRYTGYLKDGKQIAEADVAAITSDGLKALSDAAKFDLANGKITPEEYGTKVKQLKTENQKNLLDNPETLYSLLSDGIAQVADENNRISEAGATGLEVQKNAIFGHKWNYSDEEIDYYGKMVARDYGLDYNDGRIKAALSKLKTNENWIPFANSVAKSGYGRDLVKGAAPVVKGLYNYFDNMGMDDDARFAEGRSEGNREVFNKRLKSIQDDPVKNAVSTVFEGVGQLAAQAGLAYLGGEIIGAAGGMIAGDVATTAGQVVGTGARFGTGLIRSKEMLSTVTTTYIQEYDGNLKTAMNYTSDDSKARAVASSMSMLDAGLETILSPLDIAKGIGKSFYSKKKLASSILDILDDATVTNKAVAIKKAMAAATGNALKVVAGEVSEEVPAAVYDYAINGLLNPGSQRFKDRDEAKEVVQTIQQTALTMVAPALLSGVGAYKVNNFSKGTLLIAGQNRQKMIDMLVEYKENGDITEAEFNEKAAIVNTAATANNQTPIKENGKPLDTREKADYVYSRVAESILMKQLKALKEDESRTIQPTATERTADGKPKEQVIDPEITMLEKKIEKLRDDRASILSLKPTYIVDGEKVDKKTINDIIKSNTADKYDEITVHNDNATQQRLRDIGGEDVAKKDATALQAEKQTMQTIAGERITTQPIVKKVEAATEVISDPFDALFEEDKPIAQAEQIAQTQAAATPTMQDRLAIARQEAQQQATEPIQQAEQKQWNELSMQEKLALARKNLPQVESLSNTDAIKVADANAKALLGKLNEADNKILPQQSKMEVVPVKLETVPEPTPEVKTVPNDLGSGIEVKKVEDGSVGVGGDVKSVLNQDKDLIGGNKEVWMNEEGYDNYHQRLLDKNWEERQKLLREQDKVEEGSKEWDEIEKKISDNYAEEEKISRNKENTRKPIKTSLEEKELVFDELNKRGNVVTRGETGSQKIEFKPAKNGIIYTTDVNNNELAKDYAFEEVGGKMMPIKRLKGTLGSAEISNDAKILDTTTADGLKEFERITGKNITGDETAYDYLDGKQDVSDKIRDAGYDVVRTEERDARWGRQRVGTSLAILNKGILKPIEVDFSKKNVVNENGTTYKALKEGKYQQAIAEGRMTANDAKKIIESAGLEVPKDILEQSLPTQEVKDKVVADNTVLKDVESTARALGELPDNEFQKILDAGGVPSDRITAEKYHKAKKDGTNPELVKAVEQSLKATQEVKDKVVGSGVGGDVGDFKVIDRPSLEKKINNIGEAPNLEQIRNDDVAKQKKAHDDKMAIVDKVKGMSEKEYQQYYNETNPDNLPSHPLGLRNTKQATISQFEGDFKPTDYEASDAKKKHGEKILDAIGSVDNITENLTEKNQLTPEKQTALSNQRNKLEKKLNDLGIELYTPKKNTPLEVGKVKVVEADKSGSDNVVEVVRLGLIDKKTGQVIKEAEVITGEQVVGSGVEKYSEPKKYNSEIKVGEKYYDNRYGDFYTIEKLTPVEGGDVDATLKYDKGKTRTESGNFLLYHIDAKQHSLSREQPIVSETAKQEKPNDYYIKDGKEFIKSDNAKPVKLDVDGDFFAVKGDNGFYSIYEGTSGQAIARDGKLLKDAIKNANEAIERNSKAGFTFEQAISGEIRRDGKSPRYKEQSLPTQEVKDKVVADNTVLKDVESTARALGELPDNEFQKILDAGGVPSDRITAEKYHKAKKDGTNPELVKAVEQSLKATQEVKDKVVGNGVGGDVIGKTFRDNYNRTFEVKGENAGILTLEDVDTGKVLRKNKSEVLSDFKEITEPDVVDKAKTMTEHLPKGGELKGVTEIEVSENGEEVSYGTKTRKTSITVKGLSAEEIKQEIKFEKQVLERSKRDAANFNEDEIRSAKGMTRQEKEDAIKMHKQSLINNEQVEKIVIPFYEKHLEIAEQSLPTQEVKDKVVGSGVGDNPALKEMGVDIKKDGTSDGFYQVYKDGKLVGLLGATSFEQARNKGQHFDEGLMSDILSKMGIEHSKPEKSIAGENEFIKIRIKDSKAVDQSLKETPKAQTKSEVVGSVGVGGEKSILNSDVDLKGDKKEKWMEELPKPKTKEEHFNEQADNIKKTKEELYQKIQDGIKSGDIEDKGNEYYVSKTPKGKETLRDVEEKNKLIVPAAARKSEISRQYDVSKIAEHRHKISEATEGKFQKAIEEGRMTAKDAKKIIESAGLEVPKEILETPTQEVNPKQNAPTPSETNPPVQADVSQPEGQATKSGVQPSADGVGQGGAETTTPILKENDLTLQNKTEKDANDIITGKKVFERFSPAEQRGIAKGGEIHAEATVLLGRNAESGISIEGQEKIIEDYAKQKGVWFEENNIGDKNYKSADVILTEQNGEPISSYLKKESQEAIVWRSPDGENVIKAQNTEMYGGDLQQKLDGITLQNTYFENEYPVKVIGFGRDSEGNFNVIIEQKFVEAGKDDIEKSGDPAYRKQKAEKVSNYIQSIGFDKDLSNDQYTDGFTIIEDVHNQNAIVKDNGQIVIFDPIMRLNTPEQGYGGKRELSNEITETATVLKDLENKEVPERTTLLMKEIDKIKGIRSNKIKAKAIEALSTRKNNPSKKEFKYTPEEVKDALDISTNFEKDNEDILTKECPT